MPKTIFSIWWDNTLGPMVGRAYPEEEELTGEEALVIFMGHGVNQEAQLGYTKMKRGLVVSYLETPNCIAVLLDDDDDPLVVERNLVRLVSEINFNAEDWDNEIRHAYERLKELLQETRGKELLSDSGIQRMVKDMVKGRLIAIKPKHVMRGIIRYPEAADYLGQDVEEVTRKLKDLDNEGVIVPKTFGRRIECTQCGSSEVNVNLLCPKCDSSDLHKVYTAYCPQCSEQFQTVIVDDLSEVLCQHCKTPIKVDELAVMDVEPLCNKCGTASSEPKISLSCNVCGKRLKGIDLLGGTGLAYYPRHLSE